jgi:hypothetical protein
MKSTMWGVIAMGGLALALGACATDEEEAAPVEQATASEAALVARVTTPTGSTAEFWQLRPGHIFFTESGGPGTRPAAPAPRERSLASVWRAVAPGQGMPAILERVASETGDEPPASIAAEPAAGGSGGEVVAAPDGTLKPGASPAPEAPLAPETSPELALVPDEFCSPSWFYNNLAWSYCSGGGYSYAYCWYDRWLPSVWGSGLISDSGAVCNYASSNDVILTVNRQGAPSGSWSLPSSSWRTWSGWAGTSCNIFTCWYNRYDMQAFFSGSWGDLHFAGGMTW